MKTAMKTILGSCMCVLFCVGCANLQVGRPISMGNVQRIRPGFTTKSEVSTLMGEPLHNVPGPEGEIWVYRYLDGKGGAQEFVVSFNGPYVSTVTRH